MAEIEILKGSGTFSCLGLGSCIGFVALDPTTGVAGMVHVMLPEAFADRPVEKPGKFADTGIPELLRRMKEKGARNDRLVCAMAGGAQVFRFGDGSASRIDIGNRNTAAVQRQIAAHRLRVVGQDTGGNLGRTVIVSIETGSVVVRTVSQGERVLCNLRS